MYALQTCNTPMCVCPPNCLACVVSDCFMFVNINLPWLFPAVAALVARLLYVASLDLHRATNPTTVDCSYCQRSPERHKREGGGGEGKGGGGKRVKIGGNGNRGR